MRYLRHIYYILGGVSIITTRTKAIEYRAITHTLAPGAVSFVSTCALYRYTRAQHRGENPLDIALLSTSCGLASGMLLLNPQQQGSAYALITGGALLGSALGYALPSWLKKLNSSRSQPPSNAITIYDPSRPRDTFEEQLVPFTTIHEPPLPPALFMTLMVASCNTICRPPPQSGILSSLCNIFSDLLKTPKADPPKKLYGPLLPPQTPLSFSDILLGAIFGACVGDATGGTTEFQKELINGLATPVSLKWALEESDRCNANKRYGYPLLLTTDDSVLSFIVLKACMAAYQNKWSQNQLVHAITIGFMYWMDELQLNWYTGASYASHIYHHDPYYGRRGHGKGAPLAMEALRRIPLHDRQPEKRWWRQGTSGDTGHGAGCGAVMRAWPIGLVFYEDKELENIHYIAAEQSLISHKHYSSQVASVAIATGIYYTMQHTLNHREIAERMLKAASDWEDRLSKQATSHATKPIILPKLFGFNETSGAQEFALFREEIQKDTQYSAIRTSDFLRYVIALHKVDPHGTDCANFETIMGNNCVRLGVGPFPKELPTAQVGGRSRTGGLLGWVADEAVAAALYLFLQNATKKEYPTWQGIKKATLSAGDTDTISILTGALLGTHRGFQLPEADNALLPKVLEGYHTIREEVEKLEKMFPRKEINSLH